MSNQEFAQKLSSEFSPRNQGVVLSSLSLYSRKKFWWVCDKGHEWEAAVKSRYERSSSCPFCMGKKAWAGFNDLASLNPALATQWHAQLNELSPEEVTVGSSKIVWWECDAGHEWQASVKNRYKLNHGCPVCVNRKVVPKVNDFGSLHPKLAKQWHPTKNTVSPTTLSSGSEKQVWWFNEACGHEWEATVVSRAKKNAGCLVCASKTVLVGFNDPGFITPELVAQFHPVKNGFLKLSDFTYGSEQKIWWVCDKQHEWEAKIRGRKQSGCPVCGQRISVEEDNLFNHISNITPSMVLKNNRSLLKNFELDVYIPEKNFAIEFNGVYWHSEVFKSKTYHYDKWLAAKNAGVQLIQIWEDDWKRNPELVKNMLAHKLGISTQEKVYARKCTVKEISQPEASLFLNTNHIQGAVHGGLRVGLFQNDKLVAVAVFRQEADDTFNLLRYATAVNVVGGFTRLLSYVERTCPVKRFITFSDHTASDGGLYESNGFIADKELPADYMYVVKGERKHKFGYRLKRFREDSELTYVEGLTEKQLAELNNIPRIWDAGKTRWVKELI